MEYSYEYLGIGYSLNDKDRKYLKKKGKSDKRRYNSRKSVAYAHRGKQICKKSITYHKSNEILKGTFPAVRTS
jgi:hypothetical protein